MTIVVLLVLAINTGVFVLWLLLGPSPFMLENFLVSWTALGEGRWWTLVTSEFSHVWFLHFFVNMYVLASFGPIVEETVGAGRFVRFYLTAAIIASLSHAGVSAFLMGKPEIPALGASGAISGVILFFSLVYPRARILLFGLIPMPAIVGALLFVGLDLIGLIAQSSGGGLPIGHGAHLGGAATGALYYLLIQPRLRVRRDDAFDFADIARYRQWLSQHGRNRDSDG